jgi:hypothetical protein
MSELDKIIEEFKKVEKNNNWDEKIKFFSNAFSDLDNLEGELPEQKIKNIKKSNLRSLLCLLNKEKPEIEIENWKLLYDIFFTDAKNETGELCREIPNLKKYINEFYSTLIKMPDTWPINTTDLLTSLMLDIATEQEMQQLKNLNKKN